MQPARNIIEPGPGQQMFISGDLIKITLLSTQMNEFIAGFAPNIEETTNLLDPSSTESRHTPFSTKIQLEPQEVDSNEMTLGPNPDLEEAYENIFNKMQEISQIVSQSVAKLPVIVIDDFWQRRFCGGKIRERVNLLLIQIEEIPIQHGRQIQLTQQIMASLLDYLALEQCIACFSVITYHTDRLNDHLEVNLLRLLFGVTYNHFEHDLWRKTVFAWAHYICAALFITERKAVPDPPYLWLSGPNISVTLMLTSDPAPPQRDHQPNFVPAASHGGTA